MSREQITPPQVSTVNSYDGELHRPKGVSVAFYDRVPDIRRDPTVKLAREFAIAPVLGGKWSVESEKSAPVEAQAVLEEEMARVRFELLRTAMLGRIDYGWQPYEKAFKCRQDSYVGIDFLKPLLQRITTILVEERTGRYWGLRQDVPVGLNSTTVGSEVYLTGVESFVVSQDVEGTNWYGEPTLKAVEGPYDEALQITKTAKKYDRKIAGSHFIVYYPLGTSKFKGTELDNGAIAQKLVESIEAVGGMAVPRSVVQAIDSMNIKAGNNEALQWKVELLTDAGAGQTPFIDRLKYIDVLKVRAFGLPERAVIEGQFGTKAEAEAHADLAIVNMETKHQDVTAQIQLGLVDQILLMNWGPSAVGTVRLVASPLADRALTFVRELYKLMLGNPQGFMQEAAAMDLGQLRERLGLPVLPPIDPSYDVYGEYASDAAAVDAAGVEVGVVDQPIEPIQFEQDRDELGRFGRGDGGGRPAKLVQRRARDLVKPGKTTQVKTADETLLITRVHGRIYAESKESGTTRRLDPDEELMVLEFE